jgi:hypothetical protein
MEFPCVGHDFDDVGARGSPAEFALCEVGRGVEDSRVSRATGSYLGLEGRTGDFPYGVENLVVGEPDAVAQVVDPVLAGLDGVECEQVGLGEVGDVDVVADAGAVRRRVVIAEQ